MQRSKTVKKKKLIITLVLIVIVAGAVGGCFYFLNQSRDAKNLKSSQSSISIIEQSNLILSL